MMGGMGWWTRTLLRAVDQLDDAGGGREGGGGRDLLWVGRLCVGDCLSVGRSSILRISDIHRACGIDLHPLHSMNRSGGLWTAMGVVYIHPSIQSSHPSHDTATPGRQTDRPPVSLHLTSPHTHKASSHSGSRRPLHPDSPSVKKIRRGSVAVCSEHLPTFLHLDRRSGTARPPTSSRPDRQTDGHIGSR